MGEAPETGPPEWTHSGSAAIDADPSTFRGYGENIAQIGKNLQEDLNSEVMLLRGFGKDVALSTGMFPEGMECDRLTSRNASEFISFVSCLSSDLSTAFPSVARILADLYETMDVGNGASLATVDWAFAQSGASRPADLPKGYLDDPVTLEEYTRENALPDVQSSDDVVVASGTFSGGNYVTYRIDGGGTRTVVNTPSGRTETGYDQDGNVLYQTSSKPDGSLVTERYSGGELVSTTTRELLKDANKDDGVVHEQTRETTVYADDREPTVRTEHIVTTDLGDGTQTRDYYTTERVENEDGRIETERSEERFVGPQPPPMTMDDHMARTNEAMADARRATRGLG